MRLDILVLHGAKLRYGCVIGVLLIGLVSASVVSASGSVGSKGMVVSASSEASRVGLDILMAGGNAVDSAVAVGFALSVTYPEAGNLGGGGFAVIRLPTGEVMTLDHREQAPLASRPDQFLDDSGQYDPDKALYSHLASGTPGSVDGLLRLHERFGRLPREAVLAPAIELAESGFRLSDVLASRLRDLVAGVPDRPATVAKFSTPSGPLKGGDLWRQPDLARTLRTISKEGAAGFYTGWVADAIVAEMKRGGGLIAQGDLDGYVSVWREPVHGRYRGFDVYSMGPPSSGGILLVQMLNMLEAFDVASLPLGNAELIHLMTEVERRAYADRAEHLGDPDFWPVPQQALTDTDYAAARMKSFNPERASSSDDVGHGLVFPESEQTTHFSVIDSDGMMVSLTTTLNSSFGSQWVVPGTGILLNNEMDDFAAIAKSANQYGLLGNAANAIEPRKRMLSSMSPTIVMKSGQPYLITGSPGGSTIITTVLQVIVNMIDHGLDLEAAVRRPRIHHQWRPDVIYFGPNAISPSALEALRAMGHELEQRPPMGDANSISIHSGVFTGFADPREGGAALGY